MNTYGYVNQNPLINFDPTGLKSRVCCKKLWATAFIGSHCYIETIDDEDGSEWKAGLLGSWFAGENYGTGNIYLNNAWEDSKSCGEWSNDQGCPNQTDQCVKQVANAYANPSEYNLLLGPNSNTFAGTIARKCGLNKPPWHFTPGWDDPPAPQKSGTSKRPPKDIGQ